MNKIKSMNIWGYELCTNGYEPIIKSFKSYDDNANICFGYTSEIDIETFMSEIISEFSALEKDGYVNGYEVDGTGTEYIVIKIFKFARINTLTGQQSSEVPYGGIEYSVPYEYFTTLNNGDDVPDNIVRFKRNK
jgi:hypothetical protein